MKSRMFSADRASTRSARQAFATFLMLNDNYLPGALVLAYGLRRQQVAEPVLGLVTEGVSDAARQAMAAIFDDVIEVESIFVPHRRRQQRWHLRQRRPAVGSGTGGPLDHLDALDLAGDFERSEV